MRGTLLVTAGLALVLAAASATPASVALPRELWATKPTSLDLSALKRLRAQGFNAVVARGLTRTQRARVRSARLFLLSPRPRRGLRVVPLGGPKSVARLRPRGKTRVLALVRLKAKFDHAAWAAAAARADDAPWLDLAVAPQGRNRRGAVAAYAALMRRVRRQDRLAPTAPTGLGVSDQTPVSIRLSWRAAGDNRGVTGYGLYRDGIRIGVSANASAVFSGLACGRSYSLGVDAADRAGNRSARAQVTTATAACPLGGSPPPPPPSAPPAPPGLAGALPLPLPPSIGATFYVATSGADSNPGTLAAPWRTIQKAENTLAPGQRALVRAGTYAEEIYWDKDGSAVAPITIEAYPGEQPVVRAPAGAGYVFEIVASYVRVKGFRLENAQNTNIYLENPSDHVEIAANEITGSDDQGIYVEGSTANHQILGNRIHHNGLCGCAGHQSHGIYLEGANHLVASNVIHDQPTGFGIQVYPSNIGSLIVGNTVVANGYAGIVLGGSGGVRNITVRNNIFALNDQQGIAHDDTCATSSVADHNVLFGNGSGAIESGCSGVDRSGGNRTTDPLFVDFGARDLHIRSGSSAIDYGVPEWSPTTDFDLSGRTFGTGPDAGADEFSG